MALFKPIKRTSSEIDGIQKQDGQFLIATDTGEAFVDIDNYNRMPLKFVDFNLLSLTAAQFNDASFTTDTYVRITDSGTLALEPALFARILPGTIVNVLAAGQILISGAIAPSESYETLYKSGKLLQEYRELSIIVDNLGGAIITVYEKTLTNYLTSDVFPDLPEL
jgi:hypothetical protein